MQTDISEITLNVIRICAGMEEGPDMSPARVRLCHGVIWAQLLQVMMQGVAPCPAVPRTRAWRRVERVRSWGCGAGNGGNQNFFSR